MVFSDGKKPEDKVKQILSIAPILPGQKADGRFAIPKSNRHSIQSSPNIPAASTNGDHDRSHSEHRLKPSAKQSEELIDFGQNDDSAPIQAEQSHHNGTMSSSQGFDHRQRPPNFFEKNLSSSLNMMDMSNGSSMMQAPLQPALQAVIGDVKGGGSIRRLDSSSNAVDEFHDALG